jgi:hypothetical protein
MLSAGRMREKLAQSTESTEKLASALQWILQIRQTKAWFWLWKSVEALSLLQLLQKQLIFYRAAFAAIAAKRLSWG